MLPGCDRRRPAGCAAIVMLVLLWVGARAGAQAGPGDADRPTVEQLEAAVMITFARFVEWPPAGFASAAAPIVIAVVGDETLAVELEQLSRGKQVAGRRVTITRRQWDSDDPGVHMLFLGMAEKRHLGMVLQAVRKGPIVTVSRLPDFGRAGGMITLTVTGGRITFAVNSAAARSAGVQLSSLLLSHASRVSDESGGAAR